MPNSIDRCSAKSNKGWISGDYLAASNLNRFLDDDEADLLFTAKKTNSIDISSSLKRPEM